MQLCTGNNAVKYILVHNYVDAGAIISHSSAKKSIFSWAESHQACCCRCSCLFCRDISFCFPMSFATLVRSPRTCIFFFFYFMPLSPSAELKLHTPMKFGSRGRRRDLVPKHPLLLRLWQETNLAVQMDHVLNPLDLSIW